MLRRQMVVLAIGSIAIAGCRPDAPAGPSRECPTETYLGEFSGTAEGEATGPLVGCAYFTVVPLEGRSVFGMVLTDGVPIESNGVLGSVSRSIKLQRAGGTLRPGLHVVGAPETGGIFGAVLLAGDRSFEVTSGSVSVSAAVRNAISGSINITATEAGSGATITIVGTFRAACIGDDVLCNGAAA